ncbi:MAG: hypothetical protein H6686_09945 [Fibrobacteria bacterium]|nr:hypothetical protein [Fibrobacteria bacterium]
MNLPNDMQNKMKSFWERPEGTTGAFVLVGGMSLVGYGLYKFLPFIISILENTLYAVFLGVALFAVMYVLLDKRFQTLVAAMFKSVMRWITGIFITIDPIGIIKNYLETLEGNLAQMKQQLGRLKGEMKKLQMKIQENQRMMQSNLKTASAAKESGNTGVMVLQTRKAGRLQDSNLTLQGLLTKMEALYRVLFKMCEVSEILVEDVRDQIQVKEAEYNAMKAGYSAFKSALKIINGGTDEKALFDQTMQYLADDLGAKVGEIETFMEMSQGFLNSVDVQQGVFTSEGMDMLEKWEKQTESLMLGNEKTLLLTQQGPPDLEAVPVAASARAAASSSGKYLDAI